MSRAASRVERIGGLLFWYPSTSVVVPYAMPDKAITVCLCLKAHSFNQVVYSKFINSGPRTTWGIYGGQGTLTADSWFIALSWDSGTVYRGVDIGPLVGQWKFVAIGWDGANVFGGINGKWQYLGAGGIVPDWKGRGIRIGSSYIGHESFHGMIDEVRIYNVLLTESEVRALYEGKDVRDGLVLYYPMDEGEGNVLYDRSGNNNHGTIYGAAWAVKKAARVLRI